MIRESILAMFAALVLGSAGCGGDADPVAPPSPAPKPSDLLGALYDALGGAGWTNSANWGTDASLNTWYGVSTDEEGRVTEINLSDNNLLGSIPEEIALLENLEVLDLSSNGLYAEAGGAGSSVGASAEIEVCGFPQVSSRGGVTGSLPPELGSLNKLRVLNLAYNSLTDSIPEELGNLSSLEILDLGYNILSGPIPEELGRLRALKILNLCFNRRADRQGRITEGIAGGLPPALGNLENLEFLNLRSNSFSGPIPPELGRLSSLTTLDLSQNARFALNATTGLTVRVSALDSSIPPQLGDLERLEILDLSQNALSGSIPPELGGLRNLRELDLSSNAYSSTGRPEGGLTGEIPPQLGNLASLEVLDIADNALLTGAIPSAFVALALTRFSWYNTDLCIPAGGPIRAWLNAIPRNQGTGVQCPAIDRSPRRSIVR